MSWTLVGTALAGTLVTGLVAYAVIRWELRRALRPARQELDQMVVQVQGMSTRLREARERVSQIRAATEDGRGLPPQQGAAS